VPKKQSQLLFKIASQDRIWTETEMYLITTDTN